MKKAITFLLSAVMFAEFVPGFALTANAATVVPSAPTAEEIKTDEVYEETELTEDMAVYGERAVSLKNVVQLRYGSEADVDLKSYTDDPAGDYTFTLKRGTLQDGLTFDAVNGKIVGTPAQRGTRTLVFEVEGSNDLTITVDVQKGLLKILTDPIANTNLVYDGEPQSLLAQLATGNGGKMRYSTDGVTYFGYESLPAVINAGTYTIWYKVVGDSNYETSEIRKIEDIVIKPIEAEIEWCSETEFTYDRTEKSVTAVVKNKLDGDNVKLSLKGNKETDANDYTAEIIGINSVNYSLDNVTNLTCNWKIKPRDITNADVVLDKQLVYNGSEQSQGVKNIEADGVKLYPAHYSISDNTGTKADSYTLTIKSEDANFTGEAKIPFSIAKRPVELDWENSTGLVYDGDEHTITPVMKNLCAGDEITLTTGETLSATESGTYFAKITAIDNDNYTLEGGKRVATNWTISEKTLTVEDISAIDEQFYCGEAIEPKITVNGVKGLLVEDVDYTLEFENNVNLGKGSVKVIPINTNYTGTPKRQFSIIEKPIEKAIDLAAPVRYEAPQTSIETKEYTATVKWTPDSRAFGSGTQYTALIDITPKYGYTLNGIAENSFTVDGAITVTNAKNSNLVTVVFPVTSSGGGGSSAPKEYTVKFNTNGGASIASQTVRSGEKAKMPNEPTKDGYSFGGWYSDSSFKNAYDFDTKLTKNITLYAKWVKDEEKEPSSGERVNPFDDVPKSEWFYECVGYVYKNGLMEGTSKKTFEPYTAMTRGMLVTVLYRAEGEPAVNKSIPFEDVSEGSYYGDAVIWAQQNGIIDGVSENKFAPDENLTREQLAVIIFRYAKYKGTAPTGAWAIKLNYSDVADISGYALESVMYCALKNIMHGREDNTFAPQDSTTRAEIAAILSRML